MEDGKERKISFPNSLSYTKSDLRVGMEGWVTVSWWENQCNLLEKIVEMLCVKIVEKFVSNYK